ncbi:MAG: adenylate/guanylate cyclase domain-containing protein [Spirochaetaceae bacterium]|nr:adenylate/guanylate cyclase domain-containing protein [Spirochaetaceae bacterium]
MSIRLKIILIVLPLIMVSVVLAGMSSYFVAASSVTRVATEFLTFKASELEKYAESQWNLLAENGFVGRPDMEAAARAAVESFAGSILRSPTEAIVALDASGKVAMRSGGAGGTALDPLENEATAIAALAAEAKRGFIQLKLGGKDRVAAAFPFRPFGWEFIVSEERSTFYGEVEAILRTALAILAGSALASILLLLFFARYLTRPIEEVVEAMRRIIASNDLSERVPVEYKDEIGQLSHTFNLMLGELGKAYEQIKHYAFDAVVAQKREMKIRNIFQLYVPKDVIDQVFINPEGMLVGDNRVVSILFSDIRSFTSISEKMAPDDLVTALNRYFSGMVDVIMGRGGVVDKYIGDAIMAFFGAPVRHEDDALQSVLAGLEMSEALDAFNAAQRANGGPEFHIGVGINYGVVTVGNIGCEKKMNYTVIGDMVNLASRLEGLTKKYHQQLLFSESVHMKVKDNLPCRLLDTVAVKGKSKGVRIYTARRRVEGAEAEAWVLHDRALERYYAADFAGAIAGLEKVERLLPDDYPSGLFLERARNYLKSPPPADWDGVEFLTEK